MENRRADRSDDPRREGLSGGHPLIVHPSPPLRNGVRAVPTRENRLVQGLGRGPRVRVRATPARTCPHRARGARRHSRPSARPRLSSPPIPSVGVGQWVEAHGGGVGWIAFSISGQRPRMNSSSVSACFAMLSISRLSAAFSGRSPTSRATTQVAWMLREPSPSGSTTRR